MSNHRRLRSLAALVLLFTLVFPAAAGSTPLARLAPRPTDAAEAAPATVTLDQVKAALPRLEELIDSTLRRTGVPGLAVAIVFDDEVVYLKGFGVRKVGAPDLVDADTVFQLASVSKPIASTVVAGVVSDGLVSWDDRIIDHDPEFEMYDEWVTRQVTLRDMFAHRSGLPDHAGDLLEDLGYSRDEVLHRLRFQKPDSSFRSHYAYTNFGLTEAAIAAAKATGKMWEDLAAERLYTPLGMTSTSSRFAEYEGRTNRAFTHVRDADGKWAAKYVRQPDAESPAGGVSSSVRDMAQWVRLQLSNGMYDGRRLITGNALDETHRPQMVSNPAQDPLTGRSGFYGLGWNVSYEADGRVRFGHSGGFNLGAATAVYVQPADKLGIVALTNAQPIGVPETICLSLLDLALHGQVEQDYAALLAQAFAALSDAPYGQAYVGDPPAQPSPALASDAYAGSYRNDFVGTVEIAAENGGLVMVLGPDKTKFPLRHWDRDVFVYQPAGENAYGPSGVSFAIGPDGKASGVVVEYLNVNADGSFARVP